MRVLLFLIAGSCAWAQIERPQVGVMLDPNGDARVVWGVARSATLGEPILNSVLSMACAHGACLAKTAAALVSTSGSTIDAPPGPAIFGSPYIYFPQPQQLFYWHDGALTPVAFTPDGDVLALRANGDGIDYAVERGGATWVEHWSRQDNSLRLLNSFSPVNAALLTETATVLAASDEIHLITADGTDTIVPMAGVEALIAMGGGYVELVTARDRWAMDLKTGGIFLLPGLAP
jgi:hypothetical protein